MKKYPWYKIFKKENTELVQHYDPNFRKYAHKTSPPTHQYS
jgi:hypothetical protein